MVSGTPFALGPGTRMNQNEGLQQEYLEILDLHLKTTQCLEFRFFANWHWILQAVTIILRVQ